MFKSKRHLLKNLQNQSSATQILFLKLKTLKNQSNFKLFKYTKKIKEKTIKKET